MPLNTTITRDGENLKLPWSDFHVASMILAVTMDSGEGPVDPKELTFSYGEGNEYSGKTEADYPDVPFPISRGDAWNLTSYPVIATTPLNDRAYTLTREHKFLDTSDGEILHLLPGDVLKAYRSMN